MARDVDLRIILRAVDRATQPLQRVGAAVDRISRQTGLARVAREAAGVGRGLGRVGREAGIAARRLGLIGAATGGAVFGIAAKFASAGDQVAKTSDKLGLGVVELQRYRYAFELGGVAAGTTDMALQRFTRRAAEAAAGTGEAKDALEFLGIQLRDSQGRMRPTGELLADVSDAMAEIEDPALRVRVAFKLFDSEGVGLVNTLAQGSDALRAAGDEAERLGVITEEQARQSERFTDALARLRRGVSGIGIALGGELLPVMQPIIDRLREFAVESRPEIVDGIKRGVADLVDLFGDVRRGLGWTIDRLGAWGAAIERAVPGIRPLVDAIGQWIEQTGWLRFALGGVALALSSRLLLSIVALFGPLARLGAALVAMTFRLLILGAIGVAAAVKGFAKLVLALPGVTKLMRGLNAVLRANPILAVVALVLALAGAVVWVYRNWDGIVEWVKETWQGIKDALDVDAIIEMLRNTDVAGTVKGWLTGLAAALGSLWDAVTGAFATDGLITRLLGVDVAGTVLGWLSGLADRVTALWTMVTDAFGTDSLAGALLSFTPAGIVLGWLQGGLRERIAASWETITGVFGTDGLLERLSEVDVAGTVKGWLTGLRDKLVADWQQITDVFGVDAILDRLRNIDLESVGLGWIRALSDAIGRSWSSVADSILSGLKDILPGFAISALGLDDAVPAGNVPTALAPPAPLAFGPSPATARGGGEQRVGGRVQVEIKSDTTNARIRSVTSESDDVPVDASMDYLFADAAA